MEVEALVKGGKSETIQARLLRCFGIPRTWARITELLVSGYRIEPEEINSLSELLGKIKSGAANFHTAYRREAAARIRPRAKSGERAQRSAKRKSVGLADQHFSSETAEIGWEEDARRTEQQPLTGRVDAARNTLKARIEDVLNCDIVVTPSGYFFRSEDDPRVERWRIKVKKCDVDTARQVWDRLDRNERLVFNRVRSSNEGAHFHTNGGLRSLEKLEAVIGVRIHHSRLGKSNLSRMAKETVRLDTGMFIDCLKSVAETLGKAVISVPGAHLRPE